MKIQMLGEFLVVDGETRRPLPRSRKTRGLLAYLALEDRAHRREALCELLWELPSDPRAALRWSLSKLRPLFGDHSDAILVTTRDTVRLDRAQVEVDVLSIRDALAHPDTLPVETLRDFEAQLAAGFPPDLDDVGGADFRLWSSAQRDALDRLRGRVIEACLARDELGAEERLHLAGRRLALGHFDADANLGYLQLLLEQRGLSEARRAFDAARAHHREEKRSDAALVAGWMALTREAEARTDAEPSVPPADSANSGARVEARPLRGDAKAEDAALVDALADNTLPDNPLPDNPSLVVLDFNDIGAHDDGAVLANGLVADLTSRLAQISSFFVIARASAARISASRLAPREVGRQLGVRYVVHGSTQRSQDRVRVTVSLLDAGDEREIWSEHFDRPLDDLFLVQDEITAAVAATIEPAIERAEMERSLIKPPESLSAWELYHRGLWHCYRFTSNDTEQAHHWFEQAIARDPNFSRAHAGLSFAHYSRAFLNAVPDIDGEIRRSIDAAQRSVGLDARDAMGHWAQGRALFLARQHDAALGSLDRALDINPSYAQGHYAKGFVGIHAGIQSPSIGELDRAQRLSPFDPLLFAMKSSRAISLALDERYDEAVPWALRATHEPNAHFHIYAVAAALLELAGRGADAKDNARWALERAPAYSVEVFQRSFPHKDEAKRAPILDALVRAGIPRHA